MGPPPPLKAGPLCKTTDILQYKILPVQTDFGVKMLPQNLTIYFCQGFFRGDKKNYQHKNYVLFTDG